VHQREDNDPHDKQDRDDQNQATENVLGHYASHSPGGSPETGCHSRWLY
jgi:hypothetical protein